STASKASSSATPVRPSVRPAGCWKVICNWPRRADARRQAIACLSRACLNQDSRDQLCRRSPALTGVQNRRTMSDLHFPGSAVAGLSHRQTEILNIARALGRVTVEDLSKLFE